MNIFKFFNKSKEQDIVAAKLGIITICRHCHKRIHLEDEKNFPSGMLVEEDGHYVWVHDKGNKTYCATKARFRFAEPLIC